MTKTIKRKYEMMTRKGEFGVERFKVVELNDIRGQVVKFPASCSGCHETNEGCEYPGVKRHPKYNIPLGTGCEECRWRGFVIRREWVPLPEEAERYFQRRNGEIHNE